MKTETQKDSPTSNQVFGDFTATIIKHRTSGQRFVKLTLQGEHYAYVPLEIASCAAGEDLWMRDIKVRCLECRKVERIGDTECELCEECYAKCEADNEANN